jgi:hypothetical protein
MKIWRVVLTITDEGMQIPQLGGQIARELYFNSVQLLEQVQRMPLEPGLKLSVTSVESVDES